MPLSRGHGAVAAVAISSIFATTWMGFKVMGARKKYNVKFPDLYASKDNPNAEAFNCVQRGHQNTLEVYPSYIILQALSSLEYPAASAGFGAIFWVGRVLYFLGYSSGDPEKRKRGAPAYIGVLGMLALSVKGSYSLMRK